MSTDTRRAERQDEPYKVSLSEAGTILDQASTEEF